MHDLEELERMSSIELLEFRQQIADGLGELDAYIEKRAGSVTFSAEDSEVPSPLPGAQNPSP
jgi:hypothetical protein